MSVNMKQLYPVCSLCTKTKGHRKKLTVNMLKASKEEWFLTYCLIKQWSFFLQDVVDTERLCAMLSSKKKPNWQDEGIKISWELLNAATISGSDGSWSVQCKLGNYSGQESSNNCFVPMLFSRDPFLAVTQLQTLISPDTYICLNG